MAKYRITKKASWSDEDGVKHTQVEVAICTISKEDSTYYEYDVVSIESVTDKPAFYQPSTGGMLSKRFFNIEGSFGGTTVEAV